MNIMNTKKHAIYSHEVMKRAAEIRGQWSPTEKLRRTGLPPDIPARLRQFILEIRQPAWSAVAIRGAAVRVCPERT